MMAALLSALLVLSGCAMTGGSSADETADPLASVPPATQKAYGRALAKLEQGDDAEAAARLELFIAEHPGFVNPYVNLAIVRMRQQDTAAALELLEQALARDPNNVFALNQLGLIRRQQGDFAAAAAAWQQATVANPDYANAWYNLGVLNDLYLRDLPAALQNYQAYQNLTGAVDGDPAVARWIADLERRIGLPAQAARAELGR
jgi:Tfp pilus assembly protein PilF